MAEQLYVVLDSLYCKLLYPDRRGTTMRGYGWVVSARQDECCHCCAIVDSDKVRALAEQMGKKEVVTRWDNLYPLEDPNAETMPEEEVLEV